MGVRAYETLNRARPTLVRTTAAPMVADVQLLVVAKEPVPGQVKTRRCPPLDRWDDVVADGYDVGIGVPA